MTVQLVSFQLPELLTKPKASASITWKVTKVDLEIKSLSFAPQQHGKHIAMDLFVGERYLASIRRAEQTAAKDLLDQLGIGDRDHLSKAHPKLIKRPELITPPLKLAHEFLALHAGDGARRPCESTPRPEGSFSLVGFWSLPTWRRREN